MTYAIIRGKSGRRHEVNFGDALVRVEGHASEESVEVWRAFGRPPPSSDSRKALRRPISRGPMVRGYSRALSGVNAAAGAVNRRMVDKGKD